MAILVLTADPLPLPGLAATGAGLRAWSIAQGLRSAGLDARALMPAELLEGRSDPSLEPFASHLYPSANIEDFLEQAAPTVVVAQHWGMAARLADWPAPLAVDLAGPHLLERRLWGNSDLFADMAEKVEAIGRADFVFCSGRDQRLYFLPWLAMAGFDPGDPRLCPAIHFSWSPEPPPARAHAPGHGSELTFFAGGALLPWQDFRPGIETLLFALAADGKGRLVFRGGAHPALNVSGGEQQRLLDLLQKDPRVDFGGLLPFEDFVALLGSVDVAFDLFPHNNERELAFPIRTAMYLWAGIPVIHANYDEAGRWISESGAGWALDPGDARGLEDAIHSILTNPAGLAARAVAARRLAARRLDWSVTIEPLARYCRAPQRRELKRTTTGDSQASLQAVAMERELADARAEIGALQGKWPMRWARRVKRLAWLTAPIIYAGVILILAMIAAAICISDLIPSRRPKSEPLPPGE